MRNSKLNKVYAIPSFSNIDKWIRLPKYGKSAPTPKIIEKEQATI